MLTNAQCVHSHSYLFGIFQCERVPESPISPKAALILLLLSWEPLKLKLATTLFVGALISSCAVSESKTLGLIISGKLSSESMLCEMMVIVGRTRQNTKHKNSIVGVMVPTQDLVEEGDDSDGALKPLLGSLDPDGSGVRHLLRRHSRRSLCVGFHATTPDSNQQGWRAAASSGASLILRGDVGIG